MRAVAGVSTGFIQCMVVGGRCPPALIAAVVFGQRAASRVVLLDVSPLVMRAGFVINRWSARAHVLADTIRVGWRMQRAVDMVFRRPRAARYRCGERHHIAPVCNVQQMNEPMVAAGAIAAQPAKVAGRHVGGEHDPDIRCWPLCRKRVSRSIVSADQKPTPIWKLEASLKCRSCRKGRYAPPVHMIRLTEKRQTTPMSGRIRTRRGEGRPPVTLAGFSSLSNRGKCL
jgi:hypothetical protein